MKATQEQYSDAMWMYCCLDKALSKGHAKVCGCGKPAEYAIWDLGWAFRCSEHRYSSKP